MPLKSSTNFKLRNTRYTSNNSLVSLIYVFLFKSCCKKRNFGSDISDWSKNIYGWGWRPLPVSTLLFAKKISQKSYVKITRPLKKEYYLLWCQIEYTHCRSQSSQKLLENFVTTVEKQTKGIPRRSVPTDKVAEQMSTELEWDFYNLLS